MKDHSKLAATKTKAQTVTINLDTSKSDVGDVAKAIAHTKTPHAQKVAPSAALIVSLQGVSKGDTKKVRSALKGVKGVNAKGSRAGKGQVIVALDPSGVAHLAAIKAALKKLNK